MYGRPLHRRLLHTLLRRSSRSQSYWRHLAIPSRHLELPPPASQRRCSGWRARARGMKGLVPAAATAAPTGKRRWRCVAATGAALALVFFSVVVPLAVLLGLHTRFPSVYLVDESAVSVYDGSEGGTWQQVPSEEWTGTNGNLSDKVIESQPELGEFNEDISIHPAPPIQQATTLESSMLRNITIIDLKDNFEQGLPSDENGTSCQVRFGSYCRWSVEHKEMMKDSKVKILKDQLFVARAYYPSIVKLDGMEKLSREMKQNIQGLEHILSDAISDDDIPKLHGVNIAKMDQTSLQQNHVL